MLYNLRDIFFSDIKNKAVILDINENSNTEIFINISRYDINDTYYLYTLFRSYNRSYNAKIYLKFSGSSKVNTIFAGGGASN